MPGPAQRLVCCETMDVVDLLGVIKSFCMKEYRKYIKALISMTQLVEHCPAKQKVAGSIPGHGTGLGCGFSSQLGHI